jgi:hypothetical protein
MTPASERVAAGAKLLDEKRPGWWERVTRKLELQQPCGCILGQVLDAEAIEIDRTGYGLGIRLFCPPDEDAIEWTLSHGFVEDPAADFPDGPSDLEVLELEWTRAIAARRAVSTSHPTETT